MAEIIHAYLKANEVPISGDPISIVLGGGDYISCLSLDYGAAAPREAGTGRAVGRRQHSPIRIVKHIDSSSPLLFKALVNNERIEGDFRFFRPDPDGTGSTEQFFTLSISGGYVSSIDIHSEDVSNPGMSNNPPMEEVAFVFSDIAMTYERSGATHNDSWRMGS